MDITTTRRIQIIKADASAVHKNTATDFSELANGHLLNNNGFNDDMTKQVLTPTSDGSLQVNKGYCFVKYELDGRVGFSRVELVNDVNEDISSLADGNYFVYFELNTAILTAGSSDVDGADVGGLKVETAEPTTFFYSLYEINKAGNNITIVEDKRQARNPNIDLGTVIRDVNFTGVTQINGEDIATETYVDTAVANITTTQRTFELGADLTAGDIVQLLSDGNIDKITSTIGTPSIFESNAMSFTSAVEIDTNKVFIAYQGPAATYYGYGVVATISGNTISYGTPVVFESADTRYISAVKVDTNKVFIAYQDVGNSDYGTGIVATITGTVPTFGSSVVFESAFALSFSTALIDTDKVFIAYKDIGNSNYGTGVVGNISGTVLTYGTPVVFETGTTDNISATKIDTNKIFIAYRDVDNSFYGTGVVGTASATVLTFGTPVVFESANTIYVSAVKVDTNKVFISYADAGTSSRGTSIVATITGTVPTFGSSVVFHTSSTTFVSAVNIDTDRIFVSYGAGTTFLTGIYGIINGTVPTFGTEEAINNTNSDNISTTLIGSDKFFTGYTDLGNSNYGTGIVYQPRKGEEATIGILQQTGSEGETKTTELAGGISDVHSGLMVGLRYYIQSDGSISTTSSSYLLGTAISTTEIKLILPF